MMVPDCPGKMVCVLVSRSSGPGSNPSSLRACFSKVPKNKISDSMTRKLFYAHIFDIYEQRSLPYKKFQAYTCPCLNFN